MFFFCFFFVFCVVSYFAFFFFTSYWPVFYFRPIEFSMKLGTVNARMVRCIIKGSKAMISKNSMSFSEDCFCLSKQCRS